MNGRSITKNNRDFRYEIIPRIIPMHTKLTVLIAALLISICSFSQGTIKGVIYDTINKKNLQYTSISVLRAKDSTLHSFTRSAADGSFELKNLPAEKFVVLVTHPTYANYVDEVDLSATPETNLGTIRMLLKANLLADVTVRQKIAAIRMKGDTLEFRADSFHVREGASVEDLLKVLPGIQVDKNGNITAQGQKVDKVLVDGEEFFGNDPTIATQNIQANAVEKVQVFDKKSDQATFTGIDDGERSRTINLTLKDDKKRGYFGKLDLGAGTDDRWNNTAMFNKFRKDRKLSGYGIMSSTGKTGLNWDEQGSYGNSGGMNTEVTPDGGIMMWNSGDDGFDGGQYWGEGLPKSWSAGLNYSNKYKGDAHKVNGSYRYGKTNNVGGGATISQSLLPNNIFTTNEKRNSFGSRERHSINGTYDWNIDSFHSVKVTLSGSKGTTVGNSSYTSESVNEFGTITNTNQRKNSSEGENNNLSTNILFRKKFKKAGRTFSINFDLRNTENSTEGYLQSQTLRLNKLGTYDKDTVDQMKLNKMATLNVSSRINYSEPLFKNTFLQLNYSLSVNNNNSSRLSYDKDASGKFSQLNDTFSNHYKFNILTNLGGGSISYNSKKFVLNAGMDVAFTDNKQMNMLKDSSFTYSFFNLFPKGNIAYKFNPNSRLSFNYNGNTRQPTITQIQPIRDNTNPLLTYIGNPDLTQEFRQRFNLSFNSYKVLQQRGIWISASLNTVANAITTSDVIDTSGVRTLKYINVDGNYNANMWADYSFKWNKPDIRVSFNYSPNISRNNNFINGKPNTTKNQSHRFGFSLNKGKEKKYSIHTNFNVTFTNSTSSSRPDFQTKYKTYAAYLYGNVQLPWKLSINTDIEANFREKINAFDNNNNIVLLNGYIERKILKNDKGAIRLNGYDMLDQNRGFSRQVTSYTLREDTYETLSRYFTLSFVWNFSKSPAGLTPGGK